METSDDFCEECETPLLDIIYHKVKLFIFMNKLFSTLIFKDKTPLENNETTISACLYCDKIMKQCIDNYLALANKKLSGNFRHPRHFKGKRGGPKRKRRGGGAGSSKNLNW